MKKVCSDSPEEGCNLSARCKPCSAECRGRRRGCTSFGNRKKSYCTVSCKMAVTRESFMLEIKGDRERLTEKKRYDAIQPSRKSC
jgi:hypothetical protein